MILYLHFLKMSFKHVIKHLIRFLCALLLIQFPPFFKMK